MVCYVPDQVSILLRNQQQPLLLHGVCIPVLPELLQHVLPPLLVACYCRYVLIHHAQQKPQHRLGLLVGHRAFCVRVLVGWGLVAEG